MSRILILGAGGMLGNAMIRVMAEKPEHEVWGTLRSDAAKSFFAPAIAANIKTGVDVENQEALARVFKEVRPEAVINCIGLIKQRSDAEDVLAAVPVNTLLPHQLAKLCGNSGARLVHMSTDCVFNGRKGNYSESDAPNAEDVYGRTKWLGEVTDAPHAIILRTSIIGHEIAGSQSLLGWFLAQKTRVKGYRRAIFSGLPTVELARVIRDLVLPNPALFGLYHVASAPIAKFDLLTLIKTVYNKDIEIEPDDSVTIDRSLNAEKFRRATNYVAPDWPTLVARMHEYK